MRCCWSRGDSGECETRRQSSGQEWAREWEREEEGVPGRRVLFTHALRRVDLRFVRVDGDNRVPRSSVPATRSGRSLNRLIERQRVSLGRTREREGEEFRSRSFRRRSQRRGSPSRSRYSRASSRLVLSSSVRPASSTSIRCVPIDRTSTSTRQSRLPVPSNSPLRGGGVDSSSGGR